MHELTLLSQKKSESASLTSAFFIFSAQGD